MIFVHVANNNYVVDIQPGSIHRSPLYSNDNTPVYTSGRCTTQLVNVSIDPKLIDLEAGVCITFLCNDTDKRRDYFVNVQSWNTGKHIGIHWHYGAIHTKNKQKQTLAKDMRLADTAVQDIKACEKDIRSLSEQNNIIPGTIHCPMEQNMPGVHQREGEAERKQAKRFRIKIPVFAIVSLSFMEVSSFLQYADDELLDIHLNTIGHTRFTSASTKPTHQIEFMNALSTGNINTPTFTRPCIHD